MTRRAIAILIAVLLGAGLLGLLCTVGRSQSTGPSAKRPEGRLFTVSKGEVRLGIRTTGSLCPKDSIPVPSQINGKIEWLVDEGTRVKTGDVVARVEDVDYREELENAVSNLSIAEADLTLEELTRDFTQRERQRDIRRADLNLQLAELTLAQLGRPTETTIRLSQLDLESKRLVLEAAGHEQQRLEGLAAKGIVDQRQISIARLTIEGARVAHAKAVLDHNRLLAPTPDEDLAVARQEVDRSRTALDLARKKEQRDLNLCNTSVAVAQASVDRYRQIIDVQQRRVNDAAVPAPVAGTVIYPRPWGSPPLIGDQMWRGNQIVDIADLDVMTVEALVNQVDWPHVKLGQTVEIVLVAAPQVAFTGTVINVGGLAADRYLTLGGDVTGVMTFPVTVLINDKSPLLRPTYSAQLNIITEEYKNVCWVPRTAVDHDDQGNPIVWVGEGQAAVPRPVKLGSSDAVRVIISEGLGPGDVVIVPARN